MKKLFVAFATVCLIAEIAIAGGLVTNTNQSASWVRMPARDASTGIEATYFNPAGLMKLENGFHLSISNQTIMQKREVENFYTGPGGNFGLNESLYKGSVSAPIFPSVYAVYKLDKLAFSFGFNPIGGGGGATFEKGLPSFEIGPSDLVPAFASQGVNDYRLSTFFEGSSVYFGYQLGLSYKINDVLSVFGGARYVSAKNTNQGYLRDIEVFNFGGSNQWVRAAFIMTQISGQAATGASNLQPLIDGGAGTLTADQALALSIIDLDTRNAIVNGLTNLGLANAEALTIQQSQGAYQNFSIAFDQSATLLGDQEADVTQKGSAITPILGLNISLDKLNIGIKYEFATKLELENSTLKDVIVGFDGANNEITMFPNGFKFRNDMPAMLSVGASYQATEKLGLNFGGHYYFDKTANYGKKIDGEYVSNDKVIDKNFIELAAGLEYSLSTKLILSGGYLLAKTGVNENYQSDVSNSQTTNTIGFGGKYNLNERIGINLGFGYTMYDKSEKTFNHEFSTMQIPVKETYWKNTMFVGVGLDFSF